MNQENMNIVIIGHVDHGKSTVVGRLLSDTGSLPEGKLESIKAMCARNSKVFEYAFLLDALQNERDQGITIDMARAFFKSEKRHYILLDAPGHIEFLKNMVTGASRAEAAVLVIDAKEGIRENSKRHGLLASMLGIKQLIVCVNKMDLVQYSETHFLKIQKEYTAYLETLNLTPKAFIPIAALSGENLVGKAESMKWYKGPALLASLDELTKEVSLEKKPFRFFVQDIYKFTSKGDQRRIIAGKIESGVLKVGDEVIFNPSQKKTFVSSIEKYGQENIQAAFPGECIGFTLKEQIYAKRGELVSKTTESMSLVSSIFKANIFWMGKVPFEMGRSYLLKIGSEKVEVKLKEVVHVVDANTQSTEKKNKVERHEVAECILETKRPIAFDLKHDLETTSRFVIVDNYEISGGGVIVENLKDKFQDERNEVLKRELNFIRGNVSSVDRANRYAQKPALILLTGDDSSFYKQLAGEIEEFFFRKGRMIYYLGFGSLKYGLDSDLENNPSEKSSKELIRRFAESIYLLLDTGMIVVASARDLNSDQVKKIETLIGDHKLFLINVNSSLGFNDEMTIRSQTPTHEVMTALMEWMEQNGIIFSL